MRLALAKGRLEDPGFGWLAAHGLASPPRTGRGLLLALRPALDLALVRSRDIPQLVRSGAVDLGIVGLDIALESGEPLWIGEGLGFGVCRLMLAAPSGVDPSRGGLRIATRYPAITRGWLRATGRDAEVVELGGSVEVAPALGFADAIVDVVETGSTLRANGLVPCELLMESSAVLVAREGEEELAQTLLGAPCVFEDKGVDAYAADA